MAYHMIERLSNDRGRSNRAHHGDELVHFFECRGQHLFLESAQKTSTRPQVCPVGTTKEEINMMPSIFERKGRKGSEHILLGTTGQDKDKATWVLLANKKTGATEEMPIARLEAQYTFKRMAPLQVWQIR